MSDGFGWFIGCLLTIVAFLTIGVTFLTIGVFRSKEHLTITPTNDGPERNKIFLLGITTNIFLTISAIFGAINPFVFLGVSSESEVDDNLSLVSLSFYVLSQSMTVFLFIYQLEYTFKSTYLLSTSFIKRVYNIGLIMLFCALLGSLLLILLDAGVEAGIFGIILYGIWVILYFILIGVLLYVANAKVVIINSDANEELRESVKKNITQFSVLVNISVLTVFISIVLFVIISSTVIIKGFDETGLFCLTINCLVTSICVKLLMEAQLARKEIAYNKWCASCDKRKKEKFQNSDTLTTSK